MECKQHLSEFLKDELEDVVKYAEMARENHFEVRQMFHDMAEEEYEHACTIWHMMEHEGMVHSMDKHAIFHDAEAALYK